MLKIGGFAKKPTATAPEEEEIAIPDAPEEPEAPVEEAMPEEMPMMDKPKINKALVVYMGSEFGPFRCDHCQFYAGDGSCQMVEGEIDPAGCCDIFNPPDHGSDEPEVVDSPAEEAKEDVVPEEPVEE